MEGVEQNFQMMLPEAVKPRRLSTKAKMYDFILQFGPVRTSECIQFALNNHSNRGERDARQLATREDKRKIRRMSAERKARLFGNISEDVWEINPEVDPHFIDLIS